MTLGSCEYNEPEARKYYQRFASVLNLYRSGYQQKVLEQVPQGLSRNEGVLKNQNSSKKKSQWTKQQYFKESHNEKRDNGEGIGVQSVAVKEPLESSGRVRNPLLKCTATGNYLEPFKNPQTLKQSVWYFEKFIYLKV